jgi:hypothetical protein
MEEAHDDDLLRLADESNGDPMLETDNAKPGTDVVAPVAALGCQFEALAVFLEALQVGRRDSGSCPLGDPTLQAEEIRFG